MTIIKLYALIMILLSSAVPISDDSPLESQGGAIAEAISPTGGYTLDGTPTLLDFGLIQAATLIGMKWLAGQSSARFASRTNLITCPFLTRMARVQEKEGMWN
jgi:hypothetical protein